MKQTILSRKKETFDIYTNCGQNDDIKVYAKCSVNFERETYKIQTIITLIHHGVDGLIDAIEALVQEAEQECNNRLDKYREESGKGKQMVMNFEGEPAESN